MRAVICESFFKRSVFRETCRQSSFIFLSVMERKARRRGQHNTKTTNSASVLPSPFRHKDLSLSLYSQLACHDLSNPTLGHRLESPRVSIALILAVVASSPFGSTVQDEAPHSILELFQRKPQQPHRHQFLYIQSTCATFGDGLYEGLEWLSNSIRNAEHN